MLHTSKLRSPSQNGFTRVLKSVPAALALMILLPVGASAYTVVLRSGRSLEIPADFNITPAGITYQYAPGLYVTIQMAGIDITATERANNEAAGSLLSRARSRSKPAVFSGSPPSSGAGGQGTTRTLTDKELQEVRARREQSEAVYERRRVELGLPSMEESRRRREEEIERMSEMAAQAEIIEAESESYWRSRASELRSAIAVNDAEINYLRSRLGESHSYSPGISITSITPFPIFRQTRWRFPGNRFPPAQPGTGMPPPRRPYARPTLSGRIGFWGGAARGRIILNPRGPYTDFGRRRRFPERTFTVLPLPVYAPYTSNYNSYDQSALIARLQELEAERSGLQARWRLLEEEARRAGAPPGWLRP